MIWNYKIEKLNLNFFLTLVEEEPVFLHWNTSHGPGWGHDKGPGPESPL